MNFLSTGDIMFAIVFYSKSKAQPQRTTGVLHPSKMYYIKEFINELFSQ